MKWIPVIILLFCHYSSASTEATEKITFEKINNAIITEDDSKISNDDYDNITTFISSGSDVWIDLYPKLNKKPFLGVASFQEGLNIAMAYALT